MVKKRYRIKANGNIKDILRTGKIKFSCVSDMEPYEKTIKINQLRATKDHFCRLSFYNSLENLPQGGTQIKMFLVYNGVDYDIEYPDWVGLTKIDNNDNVSPLQYWVEISPNIGKSRMGKIVASFKHGEQIYRETYIITQYGKEISHPTNAEITCSPMHLQDVSAKNSIIKVSVDYVGIKNIREPFFSPYDMPWIKIQEIPDEEYNYTDSINKTYNIIIKENLSPDPRIVNIIFGGLSETGKEMQTNCNIKQLGNSDNIVADIEQ